MKLKNIFKSKLLLRGIVEIIGTMILVFVGCGTVALTTQVFKQEGQLVINALVFGITVTCLYYALSNISGAHLNPAVTFAMYLRKEISFKVFSVYSICQLIGSLIGAGFLELLFFDANVDMNSLGATIINESMIHYDTLGLFIAFFMETFFSFIFILIFILVNNFNKHKSFNGLVIGLAYSAIQFLGFMFTGSSANPARSFGPAMIAMANGVFTPASQVWIYLIAPLVGAAIACVIAAIIKSCAKNTDETKLEEREDDKAN